MRKTISVLLVMLLVSGTAFGASVNINPCKLNSTGQKSVAAAGTAERVGGGSINSVVIRADADNVGDIYIGLSTVSSTTGLVVGPGEYVSMDIGDLGDVYVDAANNDDGVSYLTVK